MRRQYVKSERELAITMRRVKYGQIAAVLIRCMASCVYQHENRIDADDMEYLIDYQFFAVYFDQFHHLVFTVAFCVSFYYFFSLKKHVEHFTTADLKFVIPVIVFQFIYIIDGFLYYLSYKAHEMNYEEYEKDHGSLLKMLIVLREQ